jgi:hypothetical protein
MRFFEESNFYRKGQHFVAICFCFDTEFFVTESKNEALHQTKEKDKKTKLKSEHSKGKEAESMKKEQQFLPLPFYACFVKAWLDVMKYKVFFVFHFYY